MFKIGKNKVEKFNEISEEEYINVNGGAGYLQYVDAELIDQITGFTQVTIPGVIKNWFK